MKQANDRNIRMAGSTIQPPCHACAFAETLYNRPRAAPPFLHLAYESKFFKVFEFPYDIRLGN